MFVWTEADFEESLPKPKALMYMLGMLDTN